MTYEEKRELRLQVSQLLADAGLNQGTIKAMVEKEISNKVDRAVDQVIVQLNSECSSGNYFEEEIRKRVVNSYGVTEAVRRAVKEELLSRVINITLKNVEVTDD